MVQRLDSLLIVDLGYLVIVIFLKCYTPSGPIKTRPAYALDSAIKKRHK